MTRTNKAYMFGIIVVFILIATAGCTRYERKVIPFKMPEAYTNATEVAGGTIAAQTYSREEARASFGFDIVGSGVLPVQVIFDNRGDHPLNVVASRTYMVDMANNLWPILDQKMAYDRIEKETEYGEVLPEGTKSGLLAGAAGAVIGTAIGIITGTSVGEGLGKGAAVGTAAGLTLGGTKGLEDTKVSHQISQDLHNRSLQSSTIPPGKISHGFIFFPGEAKEQLRELRLAIEEVDTRVIHQLIMKF
ncbi:MAG: glycine zipper family protein [Thermodesulfobacteriota bacterium]|nr:glycine zipper family protein [Thermodesulfobacteriota bacterium]